MKKVLSWILCICMVLSILPAPALAATEVDSGTCGDNLTWTLDSDYVLTISGTGDMDCSDSRPWSYYRSEIKTVVITEGVTSIGDCAFEDCTSLTSITIPDSVTSIGYGAFDDCVGLTSITIPDGVTSIGYGAFYNCHSLTSLTIPYGVTSIEGYTFAYCSNLSSITIPDGVTSIGDTAFSGCYSLTSITIPSSVTIIEGGAFSGCNFTSITIPDGVTNIGYQTFSGCGSLTSIVIPLSVTNIAWGAFEYTNLTDVYYGGGEWHWNAISIDGYMNGNDSLTNATIHYTSGIVVDSGTCGENLTWTLDGDGLLTISGTGDMMDFNDGVSPWYDYRRAIKTIVIPEGVTSIEANAFFDCTSLTSITIPDGVTSIGDGAFYDCSSLTSITIPDSVTSMGGSAFSGCGFTSITIPDGVTSIESQAFCRCYSLTRIAIPDSVTHIGDSAFYYCDALTDVYYSGTQEQWNAISIDNPYSSGNDSLLYATIHYNSDSIPAAYPYMATLSSSVSEVVVENPFSVSLNVTGDGTYADFSAAEIELAYSGNISFVEGSSTLNGATVSVENGTIKLVDNGEPQTLGDGVYTLAFTADAAGSGTVSLSSAAFGTAEEAETKDLVEAVCDTTPLNITIKPQVYNVTLPPIFAGSGTVQHGESYSFQPETVTGAYYDYAEPTATMGGNPASVTDNGDGTWTVDNVTGTLEISGTRTPKQYEVTIQGEASAQATYGTDYTFTLPADVEAGQEKGYTYALESVTIGGAAYSGYTTEDSKTYTIPGTDITGAIEVTYTETELDPNKFTVNVSGNAAGNAEGAFSELVNKGDSFTLILNPEDGYEYTVTAEGYEVFVVGNEYTIYNLTGNVDFVITKSVIIDNVSMDAYVTLDGTNMWLIKNETAKLDGRVYTCKGENMVWSEAYNAYCILVISPDKQEPTADDFAIIPGTVEELAKSKDINMTGTVDANDAQLVYNIYMAKYADFTENVTMQKFLLADVNGDNKVDVEDATAIVSDLLN